MRINGRKLSTGDGVVRYRGREYPLAGATVTYQEYRRGIPLVSRRTVATVTIRGDGWQITGRASVHGWLLRRAVDKINEQGSSPG